VAFKLLNFKLVDKSQEGEVISTETLNPPPSSAIIALPNQTVLSLTNQRTGTAVLVILSSTFL